MLAINVKLVLFMLLVFVWHLDARLTYQKKIPNGDKIPHPCKPNTIWQGVGHLNQIGGGKRNPFGLAFANAGLKWTQALCQADSDGDGKTNGEELGKAYYSSFKSVLEWEAKLFIDRHFSL